MTVQEATYFLLNQLRTVYSDGEASQVTDWIIEHLTGSKKAERMLYKNAAITEKEENLLQQYTKRLLVHEPVQYVLNESWFCGLKFFVDKNVLIPRPETEELVEWIISNCKFPVNELKILDIGTGSGCIPIALKRRIRKAEVWSCDVSEAALSVAKKNAITLGAEVNFLSLDFLDKNTWSQLPVFDIIVSNPPYVPVKDKETMQPNVLNYEPHTALFVPDNDALIFYKAIAEFGRDHLNKEGTIYLEIHEDLGGATSALFEEAGFKTELKKDIQGKDRILKADRNY
ncbi:MAG: peptide chain release factor N(5)-glutamine methyltransferase [Chitinophagaceae bacterium]|nr:peptide chain release factor N(5)-glutamine methyltransferase [Chitinophagaceae bacterium]